VTPPPPLVSVLICTYNAKRFIGQTLASVQRQTFDRLEILMLDNASTDGTPAVLSALAAESRVPIRVFPSSVNLGVWAGLNFLLDRAQGRYVAILDHDDLWHEDKIALQVDYLERHPECPGAGAHCLVWWEASAEVSHWRNDERGFHTFHSTLVFRNGKGWRYDEFLDYRTDAHFTADVLCAGGARLHNLQRPLAVWRIRSDGMNLSRQWHSTRNLLNYWKKTGNGTETLKGLIAALLPGRLFNWLLRRRHSVAEHRLGDPALIGFPPPVGPAATPAWEPAPALSTGNRGGT
jgi:glycosyltransferase involved in cell wall biosynthesis